MATSYIKVDGRSVFIIHKEPYDEKQLHLIAVLPSGDFEVVCTHHYLDTGNIKAQIKGILEKQLQEKKKQ